MPLDLRAIEDQKNQELQALLAKGQGQGLEDTLARYAGNIRNTRSNFSAQTTPLINGAMSNLGIENTGQGAMIANRGLEQNLAAGLNQERYNRTNQNLSKRATEQTRIADANYNRLNSARDFGYQTEGVAKQQNFDAQQAEQDRRYQLAMSQLADVSAAKQNALADQYQPRTDYEMALSRAFGSLLGTGVSAYAIRNMYPSNNNTFAPPQVNAPQVYGPQENWGYYPEAPAFYNQYAPPR